MRYHHGSPLLDQPDVCGSKCAAPCPVRLQRTTALTQTDTIRASACTQVCLMGTKRSWKHVCPTAHRSMRDLRRHHQCDAQRERNYGYRNGTAPRQPPAAASRRRAPRAQRSEGGSNSRGPRVQLRRKIRVTTSQLFMAVMSTFLSWQLQGGQAKREQGSSPL